MPTKNAIMAVFAAAWVCVCGCSNGGSQEGPSDSGSGPQGGKGGCGPVCPLDCEHGQVVDGNGCPTCVCNPAPQECAKDDCGAPPPIVRTCPNGSTVGFLCRRGSNGRCGLVDEPCPTCAPATCPVCKDGFAPQKRRAPNGCEACACVPAASCRASDCGPPPPVARCPDGDGPSVTCEAGADGACAWNVGTCNTCPPLTCDVACAFGHVQDESGCPTCACNPPPVCVAKDCGPPPREAPASCEDGTRAAPVCSRLRSGSCEWRMGTCPAACASASTLKTCEAAAHCRWLEPGCSGERLTTAGCFARTALNCQPGTTCGEGKACVTRTVDPCAGRPEVKCATCASPTTVCL